MDNQVIFQVYDDVNNVIGEFDVKSANNFPLALTYSIKDIQNLNSSNSSFSKTFTLPATPNNKRILKSCYLNNYRDDFDLLGLKPCAIFINGIKIIQGRFSLKSTGTKFFEAEQFDVQVLADNQEWVSQLESRMMCDLDFTQGNLYPSSMAQSQPYDKASIMATWNAVDGDDAHMVYPLVNTGKWVGGTNVADVEDFTPAYFIVNLVRLCFATIGYKVDSSFMEQNWTKKQLVLFGKQEFKFSLDTIENYSFDVENRNVTSEWSQPSYACMKYGNALVMADDNDDCTYFEGGLNYDTVNSDLSGAITFDDCVVMPCFDHSFLDDFGVMSNDPTFLGWYWWGMQGDDTIIGQGWGNGNDFRSVHCDWNLLPCGDTLADHGWEIPFYPVSPHKCRMPKPLWSDGTTRECLNNAQLALQPMGITANNTNYWNEFGLNLCKTTIFRPQQVGIYRFAGQESLELNVHKIWRWNRGLNMEYNGGDEDWELTTDCWEPSLYWRAIQIYGETSPCDSSFGNFPNWEMDINQSISRTGLDMHNSKRSDYQSEYYEAYGMSRGRYDDSHTLWNPSGTRCGDKPQCYIGTGLPNVQKTPDQVPQQNDITADEYTPWVMFNPYNPANVKNNSGADYGANLVMPDWQYTGQNPSLNFKGKNMCPMRAKLTGGVSSFRQWQNGNNPCETNATAIIPCYWTFKRTYVIFRASLFLCHDDGTGNVDTYRVAERIEDNYGWGWCMCSDELCNTSGPFYGEGYINGCAKDCTFGTAGSPNYGSECSHNGYASPAWVQNANGWYRERYLAMNPHDNQPYGCDGTGDPYHNLINPTQDPAQCQPLPNQPTNQFADYAQTWDEFVNYEDWDNKTVTGPNSNSQVHRMAKERGIHHTMTEYGGNKFKFNMAWGNSGDCELMCQMGDKVFLYSEVTEELYNYGMAPDYRGNAMGQFTSTCNNSNGNVAPDGVSFGLINWCSRGCPNADKDWYGPANAWWVYGGASGNQQLNVELCYYYGGNDGNDYPSTTIYNGWGGDFQWRYPAPFWHNMHYGIFAQNIVRHPETGIRATTQSFKRVHVKKTSYRNVGGNSAWTGTLTDTIFEGALFPIADGLPCAETMLDFVNGLTGLYNLYWYADMETKTIQVEPYANFFKTTDKAVDWTDKIDMRKGSKDVFSTEYMKRNLCFTYKEDDTLAKETHKRLDLPTCSFNSHQIDLGEQYEGVDVEDMGTNYFASTVMGFDKTIGTETEDGYCPYIPYILKEYVDIPLITNSDDLPDKIEKWKPRTLQWGGLQPCNRSNGADINYAWSFGGILEQEYPFAGVSDMQNYNAFGYIGVGATTYRPTLAYHNEKEYFGGAGPYPVLNPTNKMMGLYEIFHADTIEGILEKPKLKTAYFNLTQEDISNLNFRNLVYLQDGGGNTYWIINKISDFQPHKDLLTKVELFQWTDFRARKTGITHGDTSPIKSNIYTSSEYQSHIKVNKSSGGKGISNGGNVRVETGTHSPTAKALALRNQLDKDVSQIKGGITIVDKNKYNVNGDATRILGSGQSKKNRGNIMVGKNLDAQSNEIVIGTGRRKGIKDTRSGGRPKPSVEFRDKGKVVAEITEFGLEQGGGEVMVDDGTGRLVGLYVYDFNTSNAMANANKGRTLDVSNRKLRSVKLDKGVDKRY